MKNITKLSMAVMIACGVCTSAVAKEMKVAFMPDIHFHDVYGTFEDGSYQGPKNSKSGKGATIRSMHAQLTSTRLFNENYFALIAALDDAVSRGVKYVALPGDFSDDGQPVNVRGLQKILDRYSKEHGIEFFAAPGNHDPVRPFGRPGGKSDFLGEDGKTQRIFSKGAKECQGYDGVSTVIDAGYELPTVCSEEIRELGYEGLMSSLADYGFSPQKSNVYWETPYSDYNQRSYSFAKASKAAGYQKRQYEICNQGTGGEYKKEGYTSCMNVPDTSYLVEPTPGLWLLAIDANVYVPKANADTRNPEAGDNYSGSGNAGYNKMLTHKQQVIDWMRDVVKRAEKQNKTLVTFSHFPMTEFYNGAAETIADIFGQDSFQLQRSPREDVSKALAQTGIKLHVGGHMHFNDTGVKHYDNNTFLFNVQAPSMAAYVPAYKLLTFKDQQQVEVETVILDEVPRFNELFEHYAKEWDHRKQIDADEMWNKEVLSAKNYYEFTNWHITELTRMRFLPEDWPCDLKQMLFALDGKSMLILSQLDSSISNEQIATLTKGQQVIEICQQNEGETYFTPEKINDPEFTKAWQQASLKASELAKQSNLNLDDFARWNGFDFAVDFYRLRNADELAFKDIEKQRIPQYSLLAQTLAKDLRPKPIDASSAFGEVFKQRFGGLFGILTKFANGNASRHFMIDLEKGELTDLAPELKRLDSIN